MRNVDTRALDMESKRIVAENELDDMTAAFEHAIDTCGADASRRAMAKGLVAALDGEFAALPADMPGYEAAGLRRKLDAITNKVRFIRKVTI